MSVVVYYIFTVTFSRKITESDDSQKTLFNCVDQLLNRTRTSCLPDNENNDELSNDIADFFTGKVQKLHDGLTKAQQGIEDFFFFFFF